MFLTFTLNKSSLMSKTGTKRKKKNITITSQIKKDSRKSKRRGSERKKKKENTSLKNFMKQRKQEERMQSLKLEKIGIQMLMKMIHKSPSFQMLKLKNQNQTQRKLRARTLPERLMNSRKSTRSF